ncbi:hypothetical protein [Nonomuraea sp. NPDC050310]|uniref:hypothetical protein n=1 Tax=Nonomuraea sp. NPDC050310 TaxID=3154935 RepID=UPI0033C11E7B
MGRSPAQSSWWRHVRQPRPTPLLDLGTIAAEPTDPSAGMARAELLTRLYDAVVEALLGSPIDPLMSVQVRHLGGQLDGRVAEPYSVYMFGRPSEETARRIEEMRAALTPYTTGRKPYTFLAPAKPTTSPPSWPQWPTPWRRPPTSSGLAVPRSPRTQARFSPLRGSADGEAV